MIYLLLYVLFLLVAGLSGQWVARRDAEAHAATLQLKLDDAADRELDAYEEHQRLHQALDNAIRERNAANLRAQRATNAIRALPVMRIVCALPDEQTGVTDINLN